MSREVGENVAHHERAIRAPQRLVHRLYDLKIGLVIDGPPQRAVILVRQKHSVTEAPFDAIEVRRDVLAIRRLACFLMRPLERGEANTLRVETVGITGPHVLERNRAGRDTDVIVLTGAIIPISLSTISGSTKGQSAVMRTSGSPPSATAAR